MTLITKERQAAKEWKRTTTIRLHEIEQAVKDINFRIPGDEWRIRRLEMICAILGLLDVAMLAVLIPITARILLG